MANAMTPEECETFAPCDVDWQQCARAKIAAEQHRRDMAWFVSMLRERATEIDAQSEREHPYGDLTDAPSAYRAVADEIERAAGLKK